MYIIQREYSVQKPNLIICESANEYYTVTLLDDSLAE